MFPLDSGKEAGGGHMEGLGTDKSMCKADKSSLG